MKLDFNTYRDKVRACWLGKNIGGTIGAPFEGARGVYNVEYYTHDLSIGVLPNDDLDLQLIWLMAAESAGKNVNAEVLAEFWLSFVTADWSEYGAGKGNLHAGMLPPVSGMYKNPYGNSNGCFIRSEIWACLMPGHPELAVKYAIEDAIVDHFGEGVYAEMFCAAAESAAFAEKDVRKLIDIGLSYIPEDCMVAKCIQLVLDAYEKGEHPDAVRKKLLQFAPSNFGLSKGYIMGHQPEEDIPEGEVGYDAPCNIGLIIVGLLYGEGDFSKSICIATGYGEDADCTAGTIGAILGIANGTAMIDEKWLQPIGDEIKTCSIDFISKFYDRKFLPARTVSELTNRVITLMPTFMHGNFEMEEDNTMKIVTSDMLYEPLEQVGHMSKKPIRDLYMINMTHIRKENTLFEVGLDIDDAVIKSESEKILKLSVKNKLPQRFWLNLKWHMPEDWSISSGRESSFPINHFCNGGIMTEKKFTLNTGVLDKGKYELLLEISCPDRISKLFIPFVLINE